MIRTCIFCITFLILESVHADESRFQKTFGEVMPAPAVQAMCESFPTECEPSEPAPPMILTNERRAELEVVNRTVNDAMEYVSDFEQYGEDEKWVFDTKRGDCEEFAILKRHRLIELGWPPSTVLITVVRRTDTLMHAVLTARTSEGALILDSPQTDGSLRMWWWNEIPYIYIAQQSVEDPRRWVSLIPLPNDTAQYQRWITSK